MTESEIQAHNGALDAALEVLNKQLQNAHEELLWLNGAFEDRYATRREISVIGELKSAIEGLKRS